MTEKELTYQFLKTLQERLSREAPPPKDIKAMVDATWGKPDGLKTEREKLESKENIPFYYLAAPQIFTLGMTTAGLTREEMRKAFRCVYYAKYPELSAANAFRKSGHPFSKKWGLPSTQIMASWQKTATSNTPKNQAWPEAALGYPFPFRIVFEAKYFDGNSTTAAENELVSAIYETVFYRGLPQSGEWGYEFGCLLAYDVSPQGHFLAAWNSVANKRLFWDDAHIFVLVVRSSEVAPPAPIP
ncbi:hypothetical protein X727_16800 [Mesorhizobium sp. L103C119B0]|uniref:hypothetical protein n=1 Tax=Mesorhizobium sp. L103C119B0 TaxID=1287085 RepID=UPI0003CFA184|nr:hypothetical protein [Mesorhizobium sp. L103C119B0]ESZ69533.1 hypothetical protein X727_16800 [Mesorhizobium sp. L103C119B0]